MPSACRRPPISGPILWSFGCGKLKVLAFYEYSEHKTKLMLYFYQPHATLREVPISSRSGARPWTKVGNGCSEIMAAILEARKLANWDGRPSPVLESAIADGITIAERIMARIDSRWPAK